jgi:hypothetical protein
MSIDELLRLFQSIDLSKIELRFTYDTISRESVQDGDFEDHGFCNSSGECKQSLPENNHDLSRLSVERYKITAIADRDEVECFTDDEALIELFPEDADTTLISLIKSFVDLGDYLEPSESPVRGKCWFTVTSENYLSEEAINYSLHVDGLPDKMYEHLFDLICGIYNHR